MPQAKQQKSNDDDVLFVRVSQPVTLRREILESLKGIVATLEKFERFRARREERMKEVTELKRNVSEINKLIGKIKMSLPKANLKAESISIPRRMPVPSALNAKEAIKKDAGKEPVMAAPLKAAEQETEAVPKQQEQPVEKKKTELERLEEELSSIERKISRIA